MERRDAKGVPKDVNYTNTAIFLMQKRQAITDSPLATNFSLLEGRVNVQMPKDVNGDGLQFVRTYLNSFSSLPLPPKVVVWED